jgi:hypothetical protein
MIKQTLRLIALAIVTLAMARVHTPDVEQQLRREARDASHTAERAVILPRHGAQRVAPQSRQLAILPPTVEVATPLPRIVARDVWRADALPSAHRLRPRSRGPPLGTGQLS